MNATIKNGSKINREKPFGFRGCLGVAPPRERNHVFVACHGGELIVVIPKCTRPNPNKKC